MDLPVQLETKEPLERLAYQDWLVLLVPQVLQEIRELQVLVAQRERLDPLVPLGSLDYEEILDSLEIREEQDQLVSKDNKASLVELD